MPTDRVILCGGAAADNLPFADACPVRLDSPDADRANTRLRIEDVRKAMVREVPGAFLDLLEVAVYVYVADQAVKRGTVKAVDLGNSWHRRLFFRVPVRDPDLWNGGPVREALTGLLSFLSDDEYQFEFVRRSPGPGGIQPYLAFEDVAYNGEIDEVLLFSGGLDSLAGAVDAAVTHGRRVLLVHHRSNEKRTPRHADLVRRLGERAGHRPVHLTVHANKSKVLSTEFTQRTRSFLFGALGATAAAMVGRAGFRFYENGLTSLNLPPLEQVVGARASRTTHPQTLRGLARLFTLIAGKPFAVESPFEWLTKAEVIERITAAGCEALIGRSSSCGHTWAQSNARTHCGVCSQCIDRRFAVLAAGAADHDPAGCYGVDLFTGGWDDDQHRALLLGYIGLARRVERMRQCDFFAEFGEAARALRHYGGVRPDEAAVRVFDLHQRHARGVCRVVEQAIQDNAGALFRDGLSPNSLVRMVLPTEAAQSAQPPTPEPSLADNVFRRRGSGWEMRYCGGELLVYMPSKGLAYLYVLLINPNRVHTPEELACLIDRDRPRYALGNAGERIDDDALSAYRVRYDRLREDLEDARSRTDVERETVIREEMSHLAQEIQASTGRGGELRIVADDAERVRKSVGNAISRAVGSIRKYDQNLANHLTRPILTRGRFLCYRPDPGTVWQV